MPNDWCVGRCYANTSPFSIWPFIKILCSSVFIEHHTGKVELKLILTFSLKTRLLDRWNFIISICFVHLMIGSVHQSIYYSNVHISHSLMQLKSERVTENNFAKSPEIYNILLNYYWKRNILRSLITAFTISLKFIYMKMWLLFFVCRLR